MASAQLFEPYPLFPYYLLTADVPKISLSKLASKDKHEASRVFDACSTSGIFLLDLEGDLDGEVLQNDIAPMFALTKETLDVSLEEKLKYKQVPPDDYSGYKRFGLLKIETGRRDRYESFSIDQDEILGTKPCRPIPEPVKDNIQLLKTYLEHMRPIVSIILDVLEASLELPPGTLAALQSQDKPSGTIMRLLRCPPQPTDDYRTALGIHTDVGTITILCTILGGLQVLPPGASPEDANWRYVKPEPGCLVVLIADTLEAWTGGILKPSMHRVRPVPGEQAAHERLSFAYLVRKTEGTSRKRLVGGIIPQVEKA